MWYFGNVPLNRNIINSYNQYFYFQDNIDNQFLNDTVFFEDKNTLIILDGVIFNIKQLCSEYSAHSWTECVLKLVTEPSFPDMLRGSFSGLCFNKTSGEVLSFTNHSGERQVFYWHQGDHFIATTDFSLFKDIDVSFDLNPQAMEYIISYGFMIDDSTLYKGVKRIMPGEKIVFNHSGLISRAYHRFTNTNKITISDEEAMSRIDELFRNAVKLEFDKDVEYGLRHIIDLSGGLDCRIVNYVAKTMGYQDILNISYSQEGSNEYRAMMRLNKDLQNELLFYPLDSASFVYDAENIIKMNYGLCIYSTSTGLSKILSYINRGKFGIQHGGLMGDMRDGAFPGPNYLVDVPAKVSAGMRFSRIADLSNRDFSDIENKYENQEMFDVYTRGFLGGLSTQMIRRKFGEYFSPFMDPDFYDFFLSLPLEQRVGRKILQKWAEKYYPESLRVIDDKDMCRINANPAWKKMCSTYRKIVNRINTCAMRHSVFLKQTNMNPFDYWYNKNQNIRDFIDEYYEKHQHMLKTFPEIERNVKKIMAQGNAREKTMVVSLLASLKEFG